MTISNNATTKSWQQHLKLSRAVLADRWFTILEELQPADERNTVTRLRMAMFVEVLFTTLFEARWHPKEAEGIGEALGRLGYNRPETIAATSDVWLEHLERFADEAAWPSLFKRLSQIVSALSVGFCRYHHQFEPVQRQPVKTSSSFDDLIERDSRLRATFEGIHLGIGFTDKDGRITVANRALQQMFGYSEEELRGISLTHLTHPDDIKITMDMFDGLREKEHQYYQVEKRYLHKDGRFFWVRLTVSLIDNVDGWDAFAVGILEDITNRKEVDLGLEEMKQSLAKVRDMERLSLAQELHDGPVQHLLGVSYQMEALTRRVAARQASSSIELGESATHLPELELLSTQVIESVSQLRGLISELRPAGLLELGLTAALEGFVARLDNEQPFRLPNITLDLDESGKNMPEPIALCLFRVAQEAIRNAVRHAQASTVHVALHIRPPLVILSVSDNGSGFEIPTSINELTRANHFGLAGIIERVSLVNGEWRITSDAGKGTEILVWIDCLSA